MNSFTNFINGPILVHSDIFLTHHLINKNITNKVDIKNILDTHLNYLNNLFGKENLCFPTFNYDFPKEKIFCPKNTPSQVGALSNHVINNKFFKRTNNPIFSFCVGKNFDSEYKNKPFENNSLFSFLMNNDGYVLFYGAKINSCTFLHFVESQFGPPRYRYHKIFKGKLVKDNKTTNIDVQFHVRPKGMYLDYDWNFLLEVLKKYNVIIELDKNVFIVKAREISKIWGGEIDKDDLSILSSDCREGIEDKLNLLDRRFLIEDFEVNYK